MAESINEGTLASFAADIGGFVEADEEIATVETDKIDVPINSPEAGVVVEYLIEEGNKVSVGQTVAVIETQGGDSQAETQVADDPPELSSSPSAVAESAKPSANTSAFNISGERVVSIPSHLTFRFSFLKIAYV